MWIWIILGILAILLLTNPVGLSILGIAIVGYVIYWLTDYFTWAQILMGVGVFFALGFILFIISSIIEQGDEIKDIISKFLKTKAGKVVVFVSLFVMGVYLFRDSLYMRNLIIYIKNTYSLTYAQLLTDILGIVIGFIFIKTSKRLLNHKYMISLLFLTMAIVGAGSILVLVNWDIYWATIYASIIYIATFIDTLSVLIKYTLISSEYKAFLYRKKYIKHKFIVFINMMALLSIGIFTHIQGFTTHFELVLFLGGCSYYHWFTKPRSPKQIYEMMDKFALENVRFTINDIETFFKKKFMFKYSLATDEIMDFIEELIQNGNLIVVNEYYYSVFVYDTTLQSAFKKLDTISLEQFYEVINLYIKSKNNKTITPLSNRDSEKVVLMSFPTNIKCGYTDNNSLMLAAEDNKNYIVCEYCGLFSENQNIEGSYCSYECKSADTEEERFLENNIKYSSREVITVKDIMMDAEKTAQQNNNEMGRFGQVLATSMTPVMSKIVDKDHMMVTPQGHGFAAEEANTLIDVISGDNAQVVGYDNVKSGADRLVNNKLIQTKYYKTASQSIKAGFENGSYKYLKENGKPMQIEVPADQYAKAVLIMKKHIADGEVPGIKDPRYASRLVRKGHITYDQAKAVARAGTVESITYDFTDSMVNSAGMTGITGGWQLAAGLLSGKSLTESVRDASVGMVSVYGQQVVKEVIAKQVTKTTAGQLIRKQAGIVVTEASEVLLPKAVANTIGNIAKQNMITGAISLAWMSMDDFSYFSKGHLSKTELAGNLTSTATQLAGAAIGGEVIGGAIGTLIPIPVVGTVLGATVGAAIGGFLTSFMRTDGKKREAEQRREEEIRRLAKENHDIKKFMPFFNEIISRWTTIYMLTGKEIELFVSALQDGTCAGENYSLTYNLRNQLLRLARHDRQMSETTIFIRWFMYRIVSQRKRIVLEDSDIINVGIESWVTTISSEAV